MTDNFSSSTTAHDIELLAEPLHFPTSQRTAKNRFLKAALSELLASWTPENPKTNGVPTERIINIYQKWGHGGYGLIFTGNILVDEQHLEGGGNMIVSAAVDSNERRAAFQRLCRAAKSDGALVVAQLNHAGPQTPELINPRPFGPSDKRMQARGFSRFGIPIPLNTEQVRTEVIDKFAYAAKFFAETGYDGVQLNVSHGFLLSQFLMSSTNQRSDQYGGSMENRLRVILETYAEIRKLVPTNFIVGIKLNSFEMQADSWPVAEAAKLCQLIENAGFDFIELSGGDMEQAGLKFTRETTRLREEYFMKFIEEISKTLKKCVIYATGGFRTVQGMAQAVRSGLTHGIGFGRPTTQEPDIAKRILRHRQQGTKKNLLDQLDFSLSKMASHAQIAQMSLRPFSGNCMDGIMDLSDEGTVQEFKDAYKNYMANLAEQVERGGPVVGVLEFRCTKNK